MWRIVFVIALLIRWIVASSPDYPPYQVRSVGEVSITTDDKSYRLPNNTKPDAYDIYINTQIDEGIFNFTGSVKIAITVLEESNNITLHHRLLSLRSWKLTNESGDSIPISLPHYDPDTEFLTIFPINETLHSGSKVFLTFNYNGTLRSDMHGFYRSFYNNSEGNQVWLATTQFEATDARHAFPCFDEPALKATFDIRIEHGKSYTAISNMPLAKIKTTKDGRRITRFKRTPLMSTYLIAFVISDFQYKEKMTENGFRHRVFAQPSEIENTRYALEEGERILDAMRDYLQVNFSLPKMDQIAIPQFSAGAMENWGLVTYREPFLLFNPSVNSDGTKRQVASVIAHEFGHQWFGDLVSPKWWNYLWLNEGFATLFENIGVDLIHPDWEVFETFVTGKMHSVLKSDGYETTRPMTFYVESPRAIQSIFDNIAYAKSGSVLRMFSHAFTEKSFKKGLNYYLNNRSYEAGADLDLFNHLDRAAKEDGNLDDNLSVKQIFGSWSDQCGFPLLTVTRDYKKNTIKLSQERYFSKYPHPGANLTTFWLPYNFDTANNVAINKTTLEDWLPMHKQSKIIEPSGSKNWTRSEWILFNKQQFGFYRVLYDRRNYKLLMKELNSGSIDKLHPLNRAQLIDDTKEFVNNGRLPYNLFINLVKYLTNETEFAPWVSASNALQNIKQILVEETVEYKSFVQFVANLVRPFYELNALRIIEDEPSIKHSKRNVAVRTACGFDLEACLNDAHQLLKESIETGNELPPNVYVNVYAFGMRKADSNLVNLVWKRLSERTRDTDRQFIMFGFGNIADKTILKEYMAKTIDSSISLTQSDRTILFNAIVRGSQYGLSLAIDLLQNCLKDAYDFLQFNSTIAAVAYGVYSDEIRDQVLPILNSSVAEKFLDEEHSKYFVEIMKNSLENRLANRKIIEESVSMLLARKNFGNSLNLFSNGIVAFCVAMFVNAMVVLREYV